MRDLADAVATAWKKNAAGVSVFRFQSNAGDAVWSGVISLIHECHQFDVHQLDAMCHNPCRSVATLDVSTFVFLVAGCNQI